MKILKDKEFFKLKEIPRRKVILILGIMLFISLLGVGGYLYAHKEVTISVDGRSFSEETFAFAVENVLDEAGIKLREGDLVEPSLEATVTEGLNIRITRAKPVTVYADKKVEIVRVANPTVEKVLGNLNIKLNKLDRVETNLMDKGEPKFIRVIRVVQKEETREVPVDYTAKFIPDETMLRGERKIIQKGQQGLKKEILLVTYENGKKTEEKVIASEIVKKPVEEVVVFGTKEHWEQADRSKAREELEPIEEMVVEATAYTHTGNRTFTGIWPHEGIVAVDPKVIPLGTKMYVEGYGFAEAQDTGGAIKGKKIDVFMNTRDKALKWGRKKVKVYILEVPEDKK